MGMQAQSARTCLQISATLQSSPHRHPYSATGLMQEDWIGMRTLHEAGKLEFGECPGDHMHFNLEWWVQCSLRIGCKILVSLHECLRGILSTAQIV